MNTYDMTTKATWREQGTGGERRISVELGPHDDMVIRYECPGCEDQLLELDEPAWKALMEMTWDCWAFMMMSEVTK